VNDVIAANGWLDVWAVQSDALTNGNACLKMALTRHSHVRHFNVTIV